MIHIETKRHLNSYTLTADGHAGYDIIGKDIVCAAVSSAIYALNAGLEDIVFVKKLERDNGHMVYSVWWHAVDAEKVLSVINAVEKTLDWISIQYPENIIRTEAAR